MHGKLAVLHCLRAQSLLLLGRSEDMAADVSRAGELLADLRTVLDASPAAAPAPAPAAHGYRSLAADVDVWLDPWWVVSSK